MKKPLVITNNELLSQEQNDKINREYDMTANEMLNETYQFITEMEQKAQNALLVEETDLDIVEDDLNIEDDYTPLDPPLTDEEEVELEEWYNNLNKQDKQGVRIG